MSAPTFFRSLRNPLFARLYAAQTTSLLGDALTWVGLALLALSLAGEKSAIVLSVALTLRVTAFVLLSPLAGVIADRFDRKKIMVFTHAMRMLIVGLLPFVTHIWQLYVLIFALNVFNAFFTPTYKATIPLVTGQNDYPQAIALSSATYQLLSILGPGIAGGLAGLIGGRQVFFLDALSFLIAGVLILTLPGQLRVQSSSTSGRTWRDIKNGTTCLFADKFIRYALFMQLVASVAGAQILVNTIGYVKGTLQLEDLQYGWVMAAFGVGATVSAVIIGNFCQRFARITIVLFGALLITLALLPANYANLPFIMCLWLLAGIGQNCVDLPTQTMIADRISTDIQGRVYGAHFAWSHFWWAISYPLAGWLGGNFGNREFMYGSLVGLALLLIVQLTLSPRDNRDEQSGFWHTHEHTHDEYHQHEHQGEMSQEEVHLHPHFHRNSVSKFH